MTLFDSINPAPTSATSLPIMARRATSDVVTVDNEQSDDIEARESLLDRAFGPGRFAKTCEKLRLGRVPARGLSLTARYRGELVGTVRLWHVSAGGVPALMLGPLAVDDRFRALGIGTMLMREAVERASALGHRAILLVGDASYYARFGFERRHTRDLRMPGPLDNERFLALELRPGAMTLAKGWVRPTGVIDIVAGRANRARRQKLPAAA